eukprot:3636745-Rhodomonas_salina.2
MTDQGRSDLTTCHVVAPHAICSEVRKASSGSCEGSVACSAPTRAGLQVTYVHSFEIVAFAWNRQDPLVPQFQHACGVASGM